MAAITYESANLVWQKVNSSMGDGNPCAKAAFKALKYWLSEQFNVTDLRYEGFADIDTGIDPNLDGPYQIYAVWGKKQATATDAWLKVRDNATDVVSLPFLISGEESFAIFPLGLDIADAAGVLLESHTTSAGSTDSTAGDGPTGFLLIGAAK